GVPWQRPRADWPLEREWATSSPQRPMTRLRIWRRYAPHRVDVSFKPPMDSCRIATCNRNDEALCANYLCGTFKRIGQVCAAPCGEVGMWATLLRCPACPARP